jgi:hypothetical protein
MPLAHCGAGWNPAAGWQPAGSTVLFPERQGRKPSLQSGADVPSAPDLLVRLSIDRTRPTGTSAAGREAGPTRAYMKVRGPKVHGQAKPPVHSNEYEPA